MFLEWHEPEALTEGEMISEIEVELGRRVVELERNGCRAAGLQPTPYLYSIGFVIGTIAQGLSYANPSKPEQEGESC